MDGVHDTSTKKFKGFWTASITEILSFIILKPPLIEIIK
jgi:hypothetical protein